MKLMRRNLTPVYYSLYREKRPAVDEEGYETGETRIVYARPRKLLCSVSPATGYAQVNLFGNLEAYDKVLLTDDTACPIDENTVLFIDKEPEFDPEGYPLFDYTVRRVARSLNAVSYAVKKVTVS